MLFFLFLANSNLTAQIDNSNHNEIHNLLNQSLEELVNYNFDRSIELASISLDKSNKANYENGIIESLMLIAEAHKSNREYSTGLNYYLQALSEIEKQNNQKKLYEVNYKIGQLFYS